MSTNLNNTSSFEDISIEKLEETDGYIRTVIEAIVRLDGELTEAKKENGDLNKKIRDLESQLEEAIQTANERSEPEP